MKKLKELADKIAAEHGLEWYQPLNKAEDSAGMTAIDLGNGYSLHHEHSENGHDIWSVGCNGERAGTFMLKTEDTRRNKPMVVWAGLEKAHRGKGVGTLAYKALAVHYGGLDSDKASSSDDAVKAWIRAGGRQMKIKTQFGKPRYTLDGDKKNPPIIWNEDLVKGARGDWEKEGYTLSHEIDPYNKTILVTAHSQDGKPIGSTKASFGRTWSVSKDTYVHPDHRRKGLATGMYQYIEKVTNTKMKPSSDRTTEGKAFWKYGQKQWGNVKFGKSAPSHSLHLINKFEGSDFAPTEFHYSVKSNGKEIGRAIVFDKDPRSIHQAGKTGPSLKDIRLHPDYQGQGHSQGIINKLVDMHGPLASDSRGNISPAGAKMFHKYGIKQPDESYILHGQSLKKSDDATLKALGYSDSSDDYYNDIQDAIDHHNLISNRLGERYGNLSEDYDLKVQHPQEVIPQLKEIPHQFGWLKQYPEHEWESRLKQAYPDRKYSYTLKAKQKGELSPAVIINGKLSDGFGRVHLAHALGENIPVMYHKRKKLKKSIRQSESLKKDDDSYRIAHTAPTSDGGSPLHNLKDTYPDDIYSHEGVRYYGHGVPYDHKAISVIHAARNKPNAKVRIYRAVPKTKTNAEKIQELEQHKKHILKHGTLPNDAWSKPSGGKWNDKSEYYEYAHNTIGQLKQLPEEAAPKKLKINTGDWVATTREYAKEHGDSVHGKGNYEILSAVVPAAHVWTDGNSIHEWGYDPIPLKKSIENLIKAPMMNEGNAWQDPVRTELRSFDIEKIKEGVSHNHTIKTFNLPNDLYHHVITHNNNYAEHIISDNEDPFANGITRVAGNINQNGHLIIGSSQTEPYYQNKGYGKLAYTQALNYHGGLISDVDLSHTANSIWKHLKTLPNVDVKFGKKGTSQRHLATLKKSSNINSLIQQAKARLEGVKKVSSQEPRPMIFASKDGKKHAFVTVDPSKKGQWRVTHFIDSKPAGHSEAPTFSHAIKVAHESGYNVFKEIPEEELFKAESPADKKIYGKHSSIVYLDPYLIKPQSNDERKGSLTDLHLSGKSPVEWAKGIDLSTPIEATMYANGEVRVSDGHHRQLAAQILHKPIPTNLKLINVKNSILNSQLDSHGKSMSQSDKQNRTNELSQEIEHAKAAPESLAMFTHSLQKSEDKTRVASIVVCSGDKMLMLQRRDNDKWTFPGGHLNNGESFIDGAVRELFEEAGIRANPDELILLGDKQTFQGKTIHVYLYKVNDEVATTASNDPDKEAKQFKWLPHILPEEIKENLYIPVGDNASLSMFMKYLLSQKVQELKSKLKKD